MNEAELKARALSALEAFQQADQYLLEHDLSERCIAARVPVAWIIFGEQSMATSRFSRNFRAGLVARNGPKHETAEMFYC
jgi:hypothetical protein